MTDIGLELRLLRVATKIKGLVCEARDGLTEKEIRSVVGDNVGTGKALRSLISQGHVKRMGRGRSIALRSPGWRVTNPQVAPGTLSCTRSSLDLHRSQSTRANKGRSCTSSIPLKNKLAFLPFV